MNKGTKIVVAILAIILCIQTVMLFKVYNRVNDVYTDMVHSDAFIHEKVDTLTGKVNELIN